MQIFMEEYYRNLILRIERKIKELIEKFLYLVYIELIVLFSGWKQKVYLKFVLEIRKFGQYIIMVQQKRRDINKKFEVFKSMFEGIS